MPTTRPNLDQELFKKQNYYQAIETLHKKGAAKSYGNLFKPTDNDVPFITIFFDKRRFVKRILKNAKATNFPLSLAEKKYILQGKKWRSVYKVSTIDRVIHRAVYDILAPINNSLPDYLHGFVKGRGRLSALKQMQKFLRTHSQAIPNVSERGLYVLRTDISSYGESIPVHPGSKVWKHLNHYINNTFSAPLTKKQRQLLEMLIRPDITFEDSAPHCPLYGVPDGLPIASLLLNLYFLEFDNYAGAIDNSFYCRYGDDIIFMHPDYDTTMHIHEKLLRIAETHQLTINPDKTNLFFFNGAGKSLPELKGQASVDFLGLKVAFHGSFHITQEKMEMFWRQLRQRIKNTLAVTKHMTSEKRIQHVVNVVNHALDVRNQDCIPQTVEIKSLVDDRVFLKNTDYNIAKILSSSITGINGPKTFRKLPYRQLKHHYGLTSLVYAANTRYK